MMGESVNAEPYVNRHPERDIAPMLRRMFRAYEANDQRATSLCHGQMRDLMENWLLNRHLLSEPRWGRRTVDFMTGGAEIKPPNWYRASGGEVFLWLYENNNLRDAGKEPYEFELELCPKTGQLWRYVFRLGDPSRYQNSADAKWAFVFREGQEQSLFELAPADRLELSHAEEDPEPDIESDSEAYHNRHVESLDDDISALARQHLRDVEAKDAAAADWSLKCLRWYLTLKERSRGCYEKMG